MKEDPEAYNLSLGARRANYVRSILVKKGVVSQSNPYNFIWKRKTCFRRLIMMRHRRKTGAPNLRFFKSPNGDKEP